MKKKCLLCRQRAVIPFSEIKGRELLRCSSCDGIYAERTRKGGEPWEGREEKFLKEYLAEKNLFQNYFQRILDLIERRQKPGSLLDVGCGAGIFLVEAQKRGWRVRGVELAKEAVNHARSLGLETEKGRFEEVKIGSSKFDLVTLFQTIEHLEDPGKTLQKARSLLRPGGWLVLTTPNRESLLGKLMRKQWFGYYNEDHLFFFNKKSLGAVVEEAGFERVEIKQDSGKRLTFSWVLTRLVDYYYDHEGWVKKLVSKSRRWWSCLDWFEFGEPRVDLLVFAQKKG